MNTATLVEETLRGLPDKITVYIPWDPELEEIGLWNDWDGDDIPIQFPCAYHTYEECEKQIADFAIDTLEAVVRGDMSLPTSIDTPRRYELHRNGKLVADPDCYNRETTMLKVIRDREGDGSLSKSDFNREFAHYYAGLVAQQRNKK